MILCNLLKKRCKSFFKNICNYCCYNLGGNTENRTNDFFIKEPIKKLILKFVIPSITALLVSSLCNIVDQIFIGQSIGYLGNSATNVVYLITVIAMSITLLIGDGCAAFLSICQGSKDYKNSEKSVGNALTLILLSSVIIVLILFLTKDQIL